MLIYFDESYDHEHEYLLLSALFNPHSRYLHRRLSEVKRQHNYLSRDGSLREIKNRVKVRSGQRLEMMELVREIGSERGLRTAFLPPK
jgi:hypothetical protein